MVSKRDCGEQERQANLTPVGQSRGSGGPANTQDARTRLQPLPFQKSKKAYPLQKNDSVLRTSRLPRCWEQTFTCWQPAFSFPVLGAGHWEEDSQLPLPTAAGCSSSRWPLKVATEPARGPKPQQLLQHLGSVPGRWAKPCLHSAASAAALETITGIGAALTLG